MIDICCLGCKRSRVQIPAVDQLTLESIVVLKVAKAEVLPADGFHFVVEPLGEAIVAGDCHMAETSVCQERNVSPSVTQLRWAGDAQVIHATEKPGSKRLALLARAMLVQ